LLTALPKTRIKMMIPFVGVDLGGTHLRAAVIHSNTGEVLSLRQASTLAREGHAAVIDRMAALILEVIDLAGMNSSDVGGVGIGAPGVLDLENGMVLFLPNLPGNWLNVSLRGDIQERTGLPVFLINDARAMTFAEWKFGGGRGVDTMACYTLGTGVGGGLVINGQLHLGLGGMAGELGHQTVEPGGLPCGCGNHGCLEAYASGPAIAAAGIKAVVQGLTTRMGEMAEYDLNKITPELVYRAAESGDLIAQEIYERAGYYLGVAIGNILVALTPSKVVIGGGVSQAGEMLLEPIRRTVLERVRVIPVTRVEIVLAELGINAGLIGAASWARERIQEKPERV
jgi:glucokinase